MRFSVVIPTLGRPEMLRRTLESLAACDPAPSEVIVVDGDTTRSAEPVVADAGGGREGWRYVTGPRGSSHQRNTGIDAATGDIIVFSDDDVTYAPDVFGVLQKAYADPAIVGATTKVIEATDHKVGRKESRFRRLLPGGGTEGTFTRYGYPNYLVDVDAPRDVEFMPGCFMSARTEAARRVRFDEHLTEYGLLEDEDFSYRLTRAGRVVYLPQVTIHHLKTGFATHDKRAFSRKVVVNRSYLFKKNFAQTFGARMQFRMFIAGLFLHRVLNRDREGLRGLMEGLREVRAE
jgi:glycosyltransferase involved in cell wall biosynthesis